MSRAPIKEKLKRATLGLAGYIGDTLLFLILYGVESGLSSYSAKGAGIAYAKALRDLAEIKEGLALRHLEHLKQKGYIRYSFGKSDVEITQAGLARLERNIPVYEKRRKWDGRIYLITYDVEEENRFARDLLRDQMKKLGCGMLQQSVWVTPYDPRGSLRDFITRNGLVGRVLISYLGRESSLAGAELKDLLAHVYQLDSLDQRYEKFLESPLGSWPRFKVAFEYYAILKDDPQLPFPLLPSDWKGDKAYQKVSTILKPRP